MNWVDWLYIALVSMGIVHGLFSGLLQQSFILLRMVLAFIIATAVHVAWLPPSLITSGEAYLPAASLYGVSLAVLYMLAWVALYVVFMLIKKVFPSGDHLDFGQRLGGAMLGALRGVVLVFLCVILIEYTPLIALVDWQQSPLRQRLSPVAQELRQGIMQANSATREQIERLMRSQLTPLQLELQESTHLPATQHISKLQLSLSSESGLARSASFFIKPVGASQCVVS